MRQNSNDEEIRKCRCHHIPKSGCFKTDNIYEWTYIIDGTAVIDDNGNEIVFDDITFLWYFTKK